MTKNTLATITCFALLCGSLGLPQLAAAQDTERVHIGTGTILHRSGSTLIVDVKEGERGPGIRKINIKSTDGITFRDRNGNEVQVFDLKKGHMVSAYRTQARPAPVTISMSEAEVIMREEPAAPASEPEPAPAPAPAEPRPTTLPSTGSQLPLVLVLGLVSLGLAGALRLARVRG